MPHPTLPPALPGGVRNARQRRAQADNTLAKVGISLGGVLGLLILLHSLLPNREVQSVSNSGVYQLQISDANHYPVAVPETYRGPASGGVEWQSLERSFSLEQFGAEAPVQVAVPLTPPAPTPAPSEPDAEAAGQPSRSRPAESHTQYLPSPAISIPEPAQVDVPVRVLGLEDLVRSMPYPACARDMGLGPSRVVVRISVDAQGIAQQIQAVGNPNCCLKQAALRGVQRLRFRPAMRGGRPVASSIVVPILFRP